MTSSHFAEKWNYGGQTNENITKSLIPVPLPQLIPIDPARKFQMSS